MAAAAPPPPSSVPQRPPSPAAVAAEAMLIERIVSEVTAIPPKAMPSDVAEAAAVLPPPVLSSLIVALCQMLQTLAREVEVEREQLIDAQTALTEVLQRVVRQDEAWTEQHESLQGKERAIKELAVANARLRSQLLVSRRRTRPGGKMQLSAEEAAAVEVGSHGWSVHEDAQQKLWLVADPEAPPEPSEAGGLSVTGASKPVSRRSDGPALNGSGGGGGPAAAPRHRAIAQIAQRPTGASQPCAHLLLDSMHL